MAAASDFSPVYVLNIHADYQCRHAGACCTAGWHVPIDADRLARLRTALAERRLSVPGLPTGEGSTPEPTACFHSDSPPEGAAAIIGHDQVGACVFFDRRGGNLCAIQRDCGHDQLPVACQQFPRVALVDARGTHLALSHFCPTAAGMLFRDDVGEPSIVVAPQGAIRRGSYEGFDATDTVPPLVRPGIVADMDVASIWEAFAVASLGRGTMAPEVGLAGLIGAAERIRTWTPGDGSLADHARRACDEAMATMPAVERSTMTMAPAAASRLFLAATAAVPAGLTRPALPADVDEAYARWVVPAWPQLSRPIGRYLSAKAFAAWAAYCGEGLRTQVAMIVVALAVVRVESARQAAAAGRTLDADLLREAIRQSDLLLVHLASTEDLARRMSRVEGMTRNAYLAAIGLDQV